MNLSVAKKMPTKVIEKLGPKGLVLRQKSPEILLGLGIAGVVGGVVLSARQTMKLEEQIDIHQKEVEEAKDDKDLTVVYIRTGGRIAKLYAPAAVATIAGLAAIIGAHNIQAGRIAGLSAAYTGLSAAYDSYRDKVREELGEEKELDIHRGIESIESEEVKVLKNGKERKTMSYHDYLQPGQASLYTFLFDDTNPEWSRHADLNKSFLLMKQTYLNDKFQRQGYLFLDEVLKECGFDTKNLMYTRTVGWCKGLGDDFVDFGMFDAFNKEKGLFVNGMEPAIWLDFNVDGVIIDKVGIGLPAGILDPDLEYQMHMSEENDERNVA